MLLFEVVLYNNENIYNINTYAHTWNSLSLTFSKLPLSQQCPHPEFVLCLLPKMTTSVSNSSMLSCHTLPFVLGTSPCYRSLPQSCYSTNCKSPNSSLKVITAQVSCHTRSWRLSSSPAPVPIGVVINDHIKAHLLSQKLLPSSQSGNP